MDGRTVCEGMTSMGAPWQKYCDLSNGRKEVSKGVCSTWDGNTALGLQSNSQRVRKLSKSGHASVLCGTASGFPGWINL